MGLRLRLFTFSISITITIRIRMYIMYICSDWTGLVSGCIGVYAVLRHMEELFPFIFVLLIMFFSLFSPNMDWIAESDRLISIENNCLLISKILSQDLSKYAVHPAMIEKYHYRKNIIWCLFPTFLAVFSPKNLVFFTALIIN